MRLGITLFKPLLKAGSDRVGCLGPHPVWFWSPRMEMPQTVCQPILVFVYVYSKKKGRKYLYFTFKWSFLHFNMCPFSLVLSQDTTKNCLVQPFLYSPDNYLYTWIRSGLSLSSNWKLQLCFSFVCDGCSSPVVIFHSGKLSDSISTIRCGWCDGFL